MIANHDASQFVKPLRDDEQFHTIESTASDEEELCVIVADRTIQTGRIESITPWSIIHHTWLFLCDHGELSWQIASDSWSGCRIGIDWHLHGVPSSCLHDTPELTFWIHRYNTTPAHLFLATWSEYHFMTLFILHIVDIDRLVTYIILEYSFGRGILNCHRSFRDPNRFVFALLGWHSRTWNLPFHPFLLIGVNGLRYRQNRHRWIGMVWNTNIQWIIASWGNREIGKYESILCHLSSSSFESMNWDRIKQFTLLLFHYCYFMFTFLVLPFLSGVELVLLIVCVSDYSTIWWECTNGGILHKGRIGIVTTYSRFESMNKCDRSILLRVRIVDESVFGDIYRFERIV